MDAIRQPRDMPASQVAGHTVQSSSSDDARRSLKHVKMRSLQLITINRLEHVTIMLSYNAFIEAISEPSTQYPHHSKALTHVDNITADSWTRKIARSLIMGKILNMLLIAFL